MKTRGFSQRVGCVLRRVLPSENAPHAPATACIALACVLVACFVPVPAAAAAPPEPEARIADTSSPRATLKTFIDSCNELYGIIRSTHYFDRTSTEHYACAMRILDCLDTSKIPEYARMHVAGETAACLKEILDRVKLPPEEEIPDAEAIAAAGGLEKLSQWRVPGTRITIGRVEQGPRRHEYLFTPGTVARAAEYYEDLKSVPYRTSGPEVSQGFHHWYVSAPGHPLVARLVDRLPEWTRNRWGGLTIWKWFGLGVALPIAFVAMIVVYRLQRRYAGRWRGTSALRYCLTIAFPILAVLIPLGLQYFAERYLTIRGTGIYILGFCTNVIALLAALVVVFGVSNRIAEVIITSPRIQPEGLDAQLIRILSKLASMVVAVVVFLEGGRRLGIPVTTLLASAGIGGLAVALAAQDTLKALFGTMILMSEKPFRMGERILFGKYDGVVEDIGLRSTRLRLLTGHQVTIPNSELAGTDIENVARRPHIRRIADLRIPLDTPREKVEKAVATIREVLSDHEGMDPEFPPRVYFNEFNPDSFNIRIIYWYAPPRYWDFLAFSQKLNLQLCRAFEEQGIPFSLPTRITHVDAESQEPFEFHVVEDSRARRSTDAQ